MRLLWVLTLVLVACKSGDKPRAATGSGLAGGSALTSSSSTVQEADARAFAEKLAVSVQPCVPGALATSFVDGAHTGMFCEWMYGITSYRVVGVKTVDGEARPIMRRFRVDASGALRVNYDVVKLVKKDNNVLLADVYSYRQGKWLSELLAPKPLHPDVDAAREALRAGSAEEALTLLDKLPPDIHRDRGVLQLAVHAGTAISKAKEKKALDELAAAYPNDPATALTQIDGAFDAADYLSMLSWIDVLGREIGAEPYLDALRAVALLQIDKLDEAMKKIDASIAAEPTLSRAHEIKMDIQIEKKDWAGALATMITLERDHGFKFDEAKLRADPRLAELVKWREGTGSPHPTR
jgi:hypothetical protein